MEGTAFIHVAIMLVLFIGLVLAIAWVFQGVTEGETPVTRRQVATRPHQRRRVRRPAGHRPVIR